MDAGRRAPRYNAMLDFEALWREYVPSPEYEDTTFLMSRDALHALQNRRFLKQMERAWQVDFYRRRWTAAGLESGDIRSIEDLASIPAFSVHDLRDSLIQNPLWPDYLGIDPENDEPVPLVLQTSGGTTGLPRPMMYTPRDREVMNIITGRRLHMQGVKPFDLVQVALSLGLSNGGLLAREGIWKYTGAVPVMTGSGANTPTRRQIELLQAWKVNFIAGFPAYLRHMAIVAKQDMGIDPRELNVRGLLVHLGTDDREALENLWGAEVFDTYGMNECGSVAAESRFKSGMHVFEDAFIVELLNLEDGKHTTSGERGVLHVTSLFKHAAPIIRFNTNDVSQFVEGICPSGSAQKRLSKIFGRSDNMVKLRGVNLFPEAIGSLVSADDRTNGEYVCILETTDSSGREDMTVKVEARSSDVPTAGLREDLARRFKEALGLKLVVDVVGNGELHGLTGLTETSKIKRLIDRRIGKGGADV